MSKRSDSPGEVPWLRDMVEEDLQVLFSDDEKALARAVRRMTQSVKEDSELEERLIDLLETSLELQNDDSSASLCTTIILGESGSTRAIGVLQRSLASDTDETLQDAASVALLRIGPPAILSVMEAMDEDCDPRLASAAYSLLGMAGMLEDEELRQRTVEFLASRVELERRKPLGARALDELFRASAHLGDRQQLQPMKQALAEDYHGYHPGIQDSIEMLEENSSGLPIVTTTPPWEERYGWLFSDDREEARVSRRRPKGAPDDPGDPDLSQDEENDSDEERAMSMLFWGLNATAEKDGEDDSYDARRYLRRPRDREDAEHVEDE